GARRDPDPAGPGGNAPRGAVPRGRRAHRQARAPKPARRGARMENLDRAGRRAGDRSVPGRVRVSGGDGVDPPGLGRNAARPGRRTPYLRGVEVSMSAPSPTLDGKTILVTGGTGSLGQVLVRRLLDGASGRPDRVVVLSRDEGKQHEMRLAFRHAATATDEIIYRNFQERLQFRIGDVRDLHAVAAALRGADVVVHAAALKQVPTCEYF